MDPAPGAWTTLGGDEIKLFSPRVVASAASDSQPGSLSASEHQLIVMCGDGELVVGEVQPTGRRRMTAGDWYRGGSSTHRARFE